MPLTREERKLLHQKSKQPTFGTGKPGQDEGYDGDISFRKVEGSGTVEYVKENGSWVAVASSGEMPAVRMVGGGSGGGGGSRPVSSHSSLTGLSDDDHEDYVRIGATSPRTGTGSLDLNTTTFDLDATGAVTLDGADDSNLTVTGSNKDLAISVAGGSTQTLTISSAGTGTNAIDINATGGGIDVDAAAAVDILAATTLSAKGATGASFGDDTGTWEFDGAGAVSETGMTSCSVTPSGAITLTAGAASTWSTSSGALTITSAAAATWSAAAGNLTVDSAAGLLVLDGHTGMTLAASNNGSIEINVVAGEETSIGNNAVAQEVNLGNAAASGVNINAILVDIEGGTGGVRIDGDVFINSPYAALKVSGAGGFDLTLGVTNPESDHGRAFGSGYADFYTNYIWLGMWDLQASAEYDTDFGSW